MEKVHTIRTQRGNIINYVHILEDLETKKAFIVDPSWDYLKIMDYLKQKKIMITGVLLTHAHVDHVDLAEGFAKGWDVPVYISKEEKDSSLFSCTNLTVVEDGADLEVGGIRVKCILTPGHTPGSMCFLSKKALFTGDTVFIEGCGICDNEKMAEKMYESFQYINQNIHDNIRIYPGHCYASACGCSFAIVKERNIYCNLDQKEDFVGYRMRPGQNGLYNFV